MTCARVIPCIRLPRTMHAFDYAVPEETIETCLPGTFVVIPFRNSCIPGLVLSVAKGETKNLKSVHAALPLRYKSWNAQKKYLEWFARYYCVSQATALKTLVPSFPASYLSHGTIKKRASIYSSAYEPVFEMASVQAIPLLKKEPLLIIPATIQERYAQEIALIKNAIKKKKSIVVFFPTIHDVELFEPYARKAIGEDMVTVLHSGLSTTILFARWASLFDIAPKCILATRIGISTPLHNIGAVIIDSSERIEHNQYALNPRYDARACCMVMARHCGARLISISAAPRFEDYAPIAGTAESETASLRELVPDSVFSIINMRDELRRHGRGYISEALIDNIAATLENEKGVFLFLNRTGTSRMITCRDCGHIFSCATCGEPQHARASQLVCAGCNTNIPLPGHCPLCRSIRFHFIALGTEKIAELMKQQFPHSRVIEITQKHAAPELLKDIHHTIIVGTSFLPFAFPEAFCDIGLICALAADPIISPSDFRAEERHFQTLFHLRMLAKSNGAHFLAQTFSPEHTGIQALISGYYSAYADTALAERATHGWPPAKQLIRLRLNSARHLRLIIAQSGSSGAGSISPIREFVPVPLLLTKLGLSVRSENVREIVLSLNLQSRMKDELYAYLSSLPNNVLIDIDPVIL